MTTATLAATCLLVGLQQTPPAPPGNGARLRVFVDCQNTDCYQDYLRDEITFVEYMRDQKDAEWSNYLPRFSLHRLELDGEGAPALTRGLSVSFEIGVSRIRDQITLPKRDATDEEVLLRIRQLQSNYELRVEFGFTYQFGSKFTSIVNPRFGT